MPSPHTPLTSLASVGLSPAYFRVPHVGVSLPGIRPLSPVLHPLCTLGLGLASPGKPTLTLAPAQTTSGTPQHGVSPDPGVGHPLSVLSLGCTL